MSFFLFSASKGQKSPEGGCVVLDQPQRLQTTDASAII
jgi:hypothetical protein